MSTRTIKPCAGRLLISEPVLQDFYFRKSVVLLAEHGEEGSFGLIINKPIQLHLSEVVPGFPDFNARLFLGGPVKTDSLFFIHTRQDIIPNSTPIIDGIFWGGDIEQVRELMGTSSLSPDDIRFFVGYAGWSAGQLEQEMDQNSWIVSKTTREQIINTDPENLWTEIISSLGGDYPLWAHFPADPNLN